jgi:hypothetical protein
MEVRRASRGTAGGGHGGIVLRYGPRDEGKQSVVYRRTTAVGWLRLEYGGEAHM